MESDLINSDKEYLFNKRRFSMQRYTIIIASLVLALFFMTVPPASALAFTVNSTADGEDVNQGDGICETATAGECTLRAAIMEANASPGTDTISFHIPGDGPHIIPPRSTAGKKYSASMVECNGITRSRRYSSN